jgi:hypothetical protein
MSIAGPAANGANVNSNPLENAKSSGPIARLIAFVILILASVNGIFTFSGASLYVEENHYALLFAIAVQFSIAISLIALPYVRGLGKAVLLVIYAAALTLSTVSAYTYIYNAGLPGGTSVYTLDTQLKAHIADDLAAIYGNEQRYLDSARERVAGLERAMQEEASRGYRSGKGPGKGPEYFAKMEEYQAAQQRLEPEERNFERLQSLYEEINTELSSDADPAEQREALILLASRLGAVANDEQSKQMLSRLTNERIAVLQNPVERAISVILDRNAYSIQLVVSVIWAAVFDLLALFLGIVRYYILRPDYSILQGVYDWIVDLFTFFVRLGGIRREARLKVKQSTQSVTQQTPLNSTEMQNFATYVMAGSLFSAQDQEEALEPLQRLISYLEPLKLEHDPRGVGMSFEAIDNEPRLKTLMALLIQNEVFLIDTQHSVYVLNPGSEMAQKILIFLKMGLKDRSSSADIGKYLAAESNLSA